MGAGPSLGAGVVLQEGGAHTRRVMYVDRPPFWAHDGGGAARLSASVPASAVGAVSLQEGADGGPAIPLRSADRMVLLMEALVDFLEAVDGNLHHRSVEPDRRSPHAVLDSLPCRISEGGESEKECNICLSQFQGGDNVRILPCRHEFHATCIDKWLLEVQRTCPCCRFDICSTDPDAEPKTPEEEASERVLRADSARQNLVADLRRTAVAEAARAAATRNAMRDADVIAEPAQQGQAMSSDHRQSLASEQAQSRGRPTAGAAHSSVLSEHALGLDAGADDEAGVAFPPSPSSRPAGFGSRSSAPSSPARHLIAPTNRFLDSFSTPASPGAASAAGDNVSDAGAETRHDAVMAMATPQPSATPAALVASTTSPQPRSRASRACCVS